MVRASEEYRMFSETLLHSLEREYAALDDLDLRRAADDTLTHIQRPSCDDPVASFKTILFYNAFLPEILERLCPATGSASPAESRVTSFLSRVRGFIKFRRQRGGTLLMGDRHERTNIVSESRAACAKLVDGDLLSALRFHQPNISPDRIVNDREALLLTIIVPEISGRIGSRKT